MAAPIDMINKRFGRLTVISLKGTEKKKRLWNCMCDCGEQVVRSTEVMTRGDSASCGCLRRETTRKTMRTHNLSKTKEYGAWLSIKARCYRKTSGRYYTHGARGIKMCDRWLESFDNFILDVGFAPTKKHSIDRIDVDGDYEPNNVKWSTDTEQANNKRNNRYVTINGRRQTLMQWCRELKISYGAICRRLRRGWCEERSLLTPVKNIKYQPRNKQQSNSYA